MQSLLTATVPNSKLQFKIILIEKALVQTCRLHFSDIKNWALRYWHKTFRTCQLCRILHIKKTDNYYKMLIHSTLKSVFQVYESHNNYTHDFRGNHNFSAHASIAKDWLCKQCRCVLLTIQSVSKSKYSFNSTTNRQNPYITVTPNTKPFKPKGKQRRKRKRMKTKANYNGKLIRRPQKSSSKPIQEKIEMVVYKPES